MLVRVSTVKKNLGLRVTKKAFEYLDKILVEILLRANERAKQNGRTSIMERDL